MRKRLARLESRYIENFRQFHGAIVRGSMTVVRFHMPSRSTFKLVGQLQKSARVSLTVYSRMRKKMNELAMDRSDQGWKAKLQEDVVALHSIDSNRTTDRPSINDGTHPDHIEQHLQLRAPASSTTVLHKRTTEHDIGIDIVNAENFDPALAAMQQLRPELQQMVFQDIKTNIIDPAIHELVRTVKQRKMEDFAAAVEHAGRSS